MDNMTKVKAHNDEIFLTHVPVTWVVASKSQCETKETEGGGDWIDKVGVYNKEVKQSTLLKVDLCVK